VRMYQREPRLADYMKFDIDIKICREILNLLKSDIISVIFGEAQSEYHITGSYICSAKINISQSFQYLFYYCKGHACLNNVRESTVVFAW
jgi:hypothetical protein